MHSPYREGRCGGRNKEAGRAIRAAFAAGFGRGGAGMGGGFSGSAFGGGRFGRGAGGGHGGRRRGRFEAEALRLVVLKLIQAEARHGYDIIRAIDELTSGVYAPSPGVIYPTLSLLAEMGLIAQSEDDSTRRSFAITPDGDAYLVAHADAAEAAMARLTALGRKAGADPVPVRRAMGNLSAVLQARLAEGSVDKSTLLDIAALIDEAASKIERL